MTNLPIYGDFRITNCYKTKNSKYKAGFHTGVDIVADCKLIYATGDGIVFQRGYDSSYGNFIVLKIDDKYHWFCHLQYIPMINVGTKVNRLTKIGLMGSSGNSTGIHLHYEIRNKSNHYGDVSDPCEYMKIPNKIGKYNSNDYQLPEEKDDVPIIHKKLNCVWCGSSAEFNGNFCMMVEYLKQQFWIKEKDITKQSKNKITAEIDCLFTGSKEGRKKLVEYNAQQFWIQ